MLCKQIQKSAKQYRNNQHKVCLQRLQRLSIEYPRSIECYINLGTICMSEGKYNEALDLFTKGIQIDHNDYRCYYNIFVVLWKINKQKLAYQSLCKCVSILYVIKVYHELSSNIQEDLNKAIQLWPQNSSSYVLKSLNFINKGQFKEASDVTKQGLKNCHNKHQIYAVCCIIDSRLNKQVERQQNAKDYNDHLLRPLIFTKVSVHEQKQEIDINLMNKLVQEFNEICSLCQIGCYKQFNSHPGIAFMPFSNKFSVDVGSVICKNLGLNDLIYIEEQKKDEDEEDQKELVNNDQLKEQETFEGNKVEIIAKNQENLQIFQNQKGFVSQGNQEVNQQVNQQVNQDKVKEIEQLYPLSCANFEVKLIMADLKINQEMIGKMDPYVYFEYGTQKNKSGIAKGQGTKPRWQNQIKIFSLQKNPTIMKISIYDKQLLKWDDLVGTGELLIKDLGLQTIPIYLKQKQTGQVVLFISKKN